MGERGKEWWNQRFGEPKLFCLRKDFRGMYVCVHVSMCMSVSGYVCVSVCVCSGMIIKYPLKGVEVRG